jgi:exonuclease SbcC
MELLELSLKNFRTHKKLEITFGSGITGIVGDNGTGKSSIVEAISFLFTGEGYGSKSDMLTVGEVSGYVLGKLKIDDKEAILERHLDSSKVAFKYEGITYKKAGEVAEIWEKLFQIDKNIFKNIVIAKQGDIPLLFSGDAAVKEKIFQKIFLVPNTTKIRDTVWNKYIKTAPPEYPTLDEEQHLKDMVAMENSISNKAQDLKAYDYATDSEHATLIARERFLQNCKDANEQRQAVLAKISHAQSEQNALKASVVSIDTKLSTIDYSTINAALQQLIFNKPRYEEKVSLENKLKALNLDLEKVEINFQEIPALETAKAEVKAALMLDETEFTEIRGKVDDFYAKGLIDAKACPYCGSELADISSYVAHLESKIPAVSEKISRHKVKLAEVEKQLSNLNEGKTKHDLVVNDILKVTSSLSGFQDAVFAQGEYDLYSAVIKQYDELYEKKTQETSQIQQLTNNLLELNVSLITIPFYDNATKSMDEEFAQVSSQLQKLKADLVLKKELELAIAKDDQLLKLAEKAYVDNENIKDKNQKRNKYLYVLNEIYELLHTSQFPRKLIQTYSGAVSEYLNENLQLFNFPYSSSVNDNFGIDVFDSHGHKLPAVSGGQEIMIGVALRLALHNMFGSAFPMMVLDEGSVHLSVESKKCYFEIIKRLKKVSNFKQIIIVDHDEDLAAVVDHTVKL